MGRKTLISARKDTGVTTWMEEVDDDLLIHTHQDVEPILELNKQKQAAGRSYYAADPDMWRLASIPIGVQMQWLTKHGIEAWNDDHMPAVVKLLNSNEYKYLKTAEVII